MTGTEHKEGQYQLTVKMIGVDKAKPSMAIGVMSLISPDGEVKNYTFRSGGWGKGSLPGLNGKDFIGDRNDDVSAVYDINTGVIKEGGAFVKSGKDGYEYEQGKGFFINIFSDEVTSKTGRNGFQIHPDGGVKGTLGCVGVTTDCAENFQDAWLAIPKHLRPENLVVLKPNTELAAIVDDLEKYGKSDRQDKYMLLLTGSKGEAVQDFQILLKETGFYNGEATGNFDKQTKNAVKAFQKAHGLKIDGIVGPETFGKMYELNQKAKGIEVEEGIRVNVDKDLLKQFASSVEHKEYDLHTTSIINAKNKPGPAKVPQ